MKNLKEIISYYNEKELKKLKRNEMEKQDREKLNKFLELYRKRLSKLSEQEYINVISTLYNKNIGTDKILSYDGEKKNNHRLLKVKCSICNRERIIESTHFFSKRPLKEGMCECLRYSPKIDNTFVDTIRGTDIFIGLGEIKNGEQFIWIKCLKCGKIRNVIGKDYLNNHCINSCNHITELKSNLLQFDFNKFEDAIPYYSTESFNIGCCINNEDIFCGFISNASQTFALLECINCGKQRRIGLQEFLRADRHTLSYLKCSCCLKNDIMINGVYGNLKVISFDNKKKKYKCICLCGENKIVYRDKYSLSVGISPSCGCLSKDLKSKYNCCNYIGLEFNNLIVEKILKSKLKKDSGIYWLCTCKSCGRKVIYQAKHIVSGSVTDCGCKNRRFFEKYNVGDIVNNLQIREIFREKGKGTYWSVKCPFCENTFVRLASNICSGHYKSCGCLNKSYGEILIAEILKEYNIEYKEQFSFKDLKNGSLRFDFLIKKENKLYLIEFDGLEHYYESAQFSSTNVSKKENFKRVKLNDDLKNDFAKLKGIPLLRIPYILDKEKLKQIIKEFLGG